MVLDADTASGGARPAPARRWRNRLGPVLVVVAALAIGVPAVVGDPAIELIAITPADGTSVPGSPAEVALTFSGRIDAREFHLSVADLAGAAVTSGEARLDDQRIVVPVRLVPAGGYRVAYHVGLADGREVTGMSDFSVAAGSPERWFPPPPAAAPDAHAHGADPLSIVLTGIALLLIGALLTLLVRRPRLR